MFIVFAVIHCRETFRSLEVYLSTLYLVKPIIPTSCGWVACGSEHINAVLYNGFILVYAGLPKTRIFVGIIGFFNPPL